MLFSRILGGVGRTMIAAGVLLLLFVAYQLWGTGIRTDAAQIDLARQFGEKQAELHGTGTPSSVASTAPTDPPASGRPGGTSTSIVPTPVTTATAVPAAAGGLAAPRPGDAIGRIAIPSIGADFYMVEGVDLNYLADGPGHFPSTPFPGQPGNAALAGHRTTWKAPFNRIDELAVGDQIEIETLQGHFTYQVIPAPGGDGVSANRIISPSQTEILDQRAGENLLTLMACHPKYSAAQRIVVVAQLVGNPAASTPKSTESQQATQQPSQTALFGGTGDGLVGGDSGARSPALVLCLLAGLVWLVAWFFSRTWTWRQWQRWAIYAGALPLFLVPLFFAFEKINQLLPAGY